MEIMLAAISLLLFFSILGSLASDKLGIPSLILFLIIGIIAGPEGIGKIKLINSPGIAQKIGVISLSFIIFSGALGTSFRLVRPLIAQGTVLSTAGVAISCVITGLLFHFISGMKLPQSMLLGAIISATDAASVFSVMNSKDVRLKGSIKSMLEFESASNDPMSVILTIGIITYITNPELPVFSFLVFILKQFLIGGALGFAVAASSVFLMKRFIKMEYEGVYSVFTIGLVLFTYSIVNLAGGSPFLAVYILGIYLGNSDLFYKRNLLRFHDNISWLSQIVMFLCLGLLIKPSGIPGELANGLLATVFLIFIARPASVIASLVFFRKFSLKEMLLVSWSGLRGAAPIILSTYPFLAGIREADSIFYIIFFTVMTSVLLQGTTISFLAKLLGLEEKGKVNIKYPIEFEKSDKIEGELNEIEIPEYSIISGKKIMELGLPENVLVILIYRNNKFFPAKGKSVIQPRDRLLVLASISDFLEFSEKVLTEITY